MSKDNTFDKLDFKALSRAIQDTQLGEVRLATEDAHPRAEHKPVKIMARKSESVKPKPKQLPKIKFPRKTLATLASGTALFLCAVLVGMAIAKRLPPRVSTQQAASMLPYSYQDCLMQQGEMVGGYGCKLTVSVEDRLTFAACQVSAGTVEFVGAKPSSCSLTYLNPTFAFPENYAECANGQGVFRQDDGPSVSQCYVVIDGQGVYNQPDVSRLIETCPADGIRILEDGSTQCHLRFYPDQVWLARSLDECRYFGGKTQLSDSDAACQLRYTASDLFRYPELYGGAEITSELFVSCWEGGGFHGSTPWGVASCELRFLADGTLADSGQASQPIPANPSPELLLTLEIVDRQIVRPDVPIAVSGMHTLFGAVPGSDLAVVEDFSQRALTVTDGSITLSDLPEGEHRLRVSARVGDQRASLMRMVVVDATPPAIDAASYGWCQETATGTLTAEVTDGQTSLLLVRARDPQGSSIVELDTATLKTMSINESLTSFHDSIRLEAVDAAGNTSEVRLVPSFTCQ